MPEWSIEHQRLFDQHRRAALADARRIIARMPSRMLEPDEVDAAALRGLWRACCTWKPQTKFTSWLDVCVRSVVFDQVRMAVGYRTQSRGKLTRMGRSVRATCSIDALSGLPDQREDTYHPVTLPDDRLDLDDWWGWLVRPLDPITRELAQLVWRDGRLQKEAGNVVGLCESAVSLRLTKARPLILERMKEYQEGMHP